MATVLMVAVAKLVEGAWVTVLLIPGIIGLMMAIHRHYDRIVTETADPTPLELKGLRAPLVVVPILRWSKISKKALGLALKLSPDVIALYVDSEEGDCNELQRNWTTLVKAPAERAGLPAPPLVLLKSPYRFVIGPILDYVLDLERENTDRQVAVLIPESGASPTTCFTISAPSG